MERQYVTLAVVEPKGKQISLTDRLFDMGEDEEKVGPKGPKGFHLAPFTPQEDGLFQAYARQVRSVQQGDGPKVVSVRVAKTAICRIQDSHHRRGSEPQRL